MMEAAIEARELRYIYEDGTAALKGINLRACLLYTSPSPRDS